MTVVADLEQQDALNKDYTAKYPISTPITEDLGDHVTALLHMFELDAPLTVPLRPSDYHKIRYVVGDASAKGFLIAT